jgi:hypothetical protein
VAHGRGLLQQRASGAVVLGFDLPSGQSLIEDRKGAIRVEGLMIVRLARVSPISVVSPHQREYREHDERRHDEEEE